ncbi:hypothetical protein LIP_2757 [Limnochorda pilosa]|uniref:Uncharacterized protein n=1 Tax=Limnochorda pilosa TaxID=1555112 RepID=A0A0K2SNJ7_LIMPI|nr:hypothetical protein LIP_2757 [Limnochorda pilosa]
MLSPEKPADLLFQRLLDQPPHAEPSDLAQERTAVPFGQPVLQKLLDLLAKLTRRWYPLHRDLGLLSWLATAATRITQVPHFLQHAGDVTRDVEEIYDYTGVGTPVIVLE